MSKLYFKYGCMNSSKSANLLMIKHNYEEQGFNVLLLKPSIDSREGEPIVKSRIGIQSPCTMIQNDKSIFEYFDKSIAQIVMVDEAQFLTEKQVEDLYEISFDFNVICFGLLTDFRQRLFEGSRRLIELAESIQEIKTVCKCGARAVHNARIDDNGKVISSGDQIVVGGNERYKSMCKNCYRRCSTGNIYLKENN